MDWVQDMTAHWAQIMSTAGEGRAPLDEAVRQIRAIGGTPAKESRSSGLKRNRRAPADAPAVTVLARLLVAGVIVSDLMIERLAAVAGQTREQMLDQLVSAASGQQLRDQQLSAVRAELPGSCAELQDQSR